MLWILIISTLLFWFLAFYYYILWKKGYGARQGFGDIFIAKLVKPSFATGSEKKYLLGVITILILLPFFLFGGFFFYFLR